MIAAILQQRLYQQILTDVATATGSTVEGLTKDERIFGNFGPASARDVLARATEEHTLLR